MRIVTGIVSLAISVVVCASVGLAQEDAGNEAISAKQLVVMIDGRFPTTGALSSGAGIVVGRKGGFLYIATAGHVVHAFAETAQDVSVEFIDKPGVEIDATVISTNFDKAIDIGILAIPEANAPLSILASDYFPVGRLSDVVKDGDLAQYIGQAGGKPWSGQAAPERVISSGATEIKIETRSVEPGLSGGAALDENSKIIGVIIETNGGSVRVIPLGYLKEILEESGFPFVLDDANSEPRLKDSERALNATARAWEILTEKSPGNTGKREAITFLVSRGVELNSIDLSCKSMGGLSEDPTAYPRCRNRTFLEGLDLSGIENVRLEKANLSGADLRNASIPNANLGFVDFSEAWMGKVNFSNSKLFAANFERAEAYESNFQNASLSSIEAERANFSSSDFTDGILSSANINRGSLFNAKLRNANLDFLRAIDANLSFADFSGARMTRAQLKNADLAGANLSNTNLSGADLTGVKIDELTKFEGAWVWDNDMPLGVNPYKHGILVCTFDYNKHDIYTFPNECK